MNGYGPHGFQDLEVLNSSYPAVLVTAGQTHSKPQDQLPEQLATKAVSEE